MDQFNTFMNGNFCEPVSTEDNSNVNGQFSDLAGFGNNDGHVDMCLPVGNSNGDSNDNANMDQDQLLEPMPALPDNAKRALQGDFMSHGNNHGDNSNDLFGSCSFTTNNGSTMNMNMSSGNDNSGIMNSATSVAASSEPYFDKSKSTPPSRSGIKFYSRNDVLCGRGGGTNVHPGNRRFRDLINANRRAYLKARKNDKPAISRSIVRTIREMSGRFLKKDENLGLWFEIGDDGAREKTSQALRQRAPEMKKILFEDEQRQRNEQLMRQQQQAQLMQRSFMQCAAAAGNNGIQNTNQCDGGMNGASTFNNQAMQFDNNSFSNNNNLLNNTSSNNNFSRNSQLMNMASTMMDHGNNNFNNDLNNNSNTDPSNSNSNGSIYEQYAMLQQKNYFAKMGSQENNMFLKKLTMNGSSFDSNNFQRQQRNIDNLASQTLLSQGIKPITPRGA